MVNQVMDEGLGLIDVSQEDDNLLSCVEQQDFDFCSSPVSFLSADAKHQTDVGGEKPAASSEEVIDVHASVAERSTVAEAAETGQPKRNRIGISNLRKSLAWDQAFFTSEGFLDAEELSFLTATSKKLLERLPSTSEESEERYLFSASQDVAKQQHMKKFSIDDKATEESSKSAVGKAPEEPSKSAVGRATQGENSISVPVGSTKDTATRNKRIKFSHNFLSGNLPAATKCDTRSLAPAQSCRKITSRSSNLPSKRFDGMHSVGTGNKIRISKEKSQSSHLRNSKNHNPLRGKDPSNLGNASSSTFGAQHMSTKDNVCSLNIPTKSTKNSANTVASSITFTSKPNQKMENNHLQKHSGTDHSSDTPSANLGNAISTTYSSKGSGLRKPSPKLGFFDSRRLSTGLQANSTKARALPPKSMARVSSSVSSTGKLKIPGVPCAKSSSIPFCSPTHSSLPQISERNPQHNQVIHFQPQDKQSQVSSLALLAQKKFGSSPSTKLSCFERKINSIRTLSTTTNNQIRESKTPTADEPSSVKNGWSNVADENPVIQPESRETSTDHAKLMTLEDQVSVLNLGKDGSKEAGYHHPQDSETEGEIKVCDTTFSENQTPNVDEDYSVKNGGPNLAQEILTLQPDSGEASTDNAKLVTLRQQPSLLILEKDMLKGPQSLENGCHYPYESGTPNSQSEDTTKIKCCNPEEENMVLQRDSGEVSSEQTKLATLAQNLSMLRLEKEVSKGLGSVESRCHNAVEFEIRNSKTEGERKASGSYETYETISDPKTIDAETAATNQACKNIQRSLTEEIEITMCGRTPLLACNSESSPCAQENEISQKPGMNEDSQIAGKENNIPGAVHKEKRA